MKILILGGTQMIGRDFVEFLLQIDGNHNIYIANRGVTNSNLFIGNNIYNKKIDRNNIELCKILSGMSFDLVIDFSCYNKNQLQNILYYIKYTRYIILSTLCVSDQTVLSDKGHWLYNYCKDKKELEKYIFENTSQITWDKIQKIFFEYHEDVEKLTSEQLNKERLKFVKFFASKGFNNHHVVLGRYQSFIYFWKS